MIGKLGLAAAVYWTPQQDAFLRNNAANGWLWCAEQLGKTKNAVYCRSQKLGLGRRQMTAERLERLKALQAQGLTPVLIGSHLGISDECVRWHLRRLGIAANRRDESIRVEKLNRTLQARYGVSSVGGIRQVIGRKRAEQLGCPGLPFTVAITLAALRRLNRPATKIELADERCRIASEHGWSLKRSPQAAWQGVARLVRIGLTECRGTGKQLRKFSLVRQDEAAA